MPQMPSMLSDRKGWRSFLCVKFDNECIHTDHGKRGQLSKL